MILPTFAFFGKRSVPVVFCVSDTRAAHPSWPIKFFHSISLMFKHAWSCNVVMVSLRCEEACQTPTFTLLQCSATAKL